MDPFSNFAVARVSQGYTEAATSIVLQSGGALRLAGGAFARAFNAVWWNATDYPNPDDDPNREIVRVIAITSETLSITRSQENTSSTSKNTGGKVYRMAASLTAKTLDEFRNVVSVTSNYPATPGDWLIRADATAGNIVVTPDASTRSQYVVKKIDNSGNTVTVAGTIDGVVDYVLAVQYAWVSIAYNGTNWDVIGKNP